MTDDRAPPEIQEGRWTLKLEFHQTCATVLSWYPEEQEAPYAVGTWRPATRTMANKTLYFPDRHMAEEKFREVADFWVSVDKRRRISNGRRH